MPGRSLSYKEMRGLLYGRSLQFSSGTTTNPEMEHSLAAICSKEKSENAKAIENPGATTKMLLQHFRDCMNPSGWYSLSAELFSQQPMRPLVHALTHALPSCSTTSHSSLLPMEDRATMALSVRDRERLKQIRGTMSETEPTPFLAILDSQDHNITPALPPEEGGDSDCEMILAPASSCTGALGHSKPKPEDLAAITEVASNNGMVVFRVSDKRPALKKRPLSFADSVTTDDFAIRLYRVEAVDAATETASPTAVTVSALDHVTVPLAKLFSGGDRAENLVEDMLQWACASELKHLVNIPRDKVGSAAFDLIQDLVQAGAVVGSSVHFDTTGMTSDRDLQLLDKMVHESILVPTRNGSAVQLCASAVSCHLVLTQPRRVFDARIGSCPQLDRLSLTQGSRPTQWELYLNLRRKGWRKADWQGEKKDLKFSLVEPGREKLFYHDGYWYWLCLLNCEALATLGLSLYPGQLESFYQTAIRLGKEDPEKLPSLRPQQKASVYKQLAGGRRSVDCGGRESVHSVAFLELMADPGDSNLQVASQQAWFSPMREREIYIYS